MIKITSPLDFENILQEVGNPTRIVDTNRSIKEQSGNSQIRSYFNDHTPDKDSFYLWTIQMGSEHWLHNQNGDSWPEKWLQPKDTNKYGYKTFQNQYFHREHVNKKKHDRIGNVLVSVFDPDKHWVELLIRGDLKPREGEPLTAEPEYYRQKEGKNVDVSMAAYIKEDRCSICNNAAPKTQNWCSHLKTRLGKFIPEAEKYQHARNVEPVFFDISSVKNRADKIARFMAYKFSDGSEITQKRQSCGHNNDIVTGSDLQDMYDISGDSVKTSSYKRALDVLEKVQNKYRNTPQEQVIREAVDGFRGIGLDQREKRQFQETRVPSLMRKLQCHRCVLTPQAFLDTFQGDMEPHIVRRTIRIIARPIQPEIEDVLKMIPGIMSQFEMSPSQTENIDTGDGIDKLMQSAVDKVGIKDDADVKKIIIIVNNNPNLKEQSQDIILPADEESQQVQWQNAYKVFKVASINNIIQLYGEDFQSDSQIQQIYNL